MAMLSVLKDEVIRLINDLSPEALVEVRQFVEMLKQKAQSKPAPPPVAIGGWLRGHRFSSDDIAQARAEMWARFSSDPA